MPCRHLWFWFTPFLALWLCPAQSQSQAFSGHDQTIPSQRSIVAADDPFKELMKDEKKPSALDKAFTDEKTSDSFLSRFVLRGEVWNKFSFDVGDETPFEDDYSNHFEARLEVKYPLSSTVQFVVGLRANYFAYGPGDGWNHDGDVRLDNAYINLALGEVNVRFGNQIVKWGKADEVSPLDNVNPEELRDGFVRRRSERKLAIPMLNVEFFSGTSTLQGIVVPFFKKSDFDLDGRNWAFFDHSLAEIGPFAIQENEPSTQLDTVEGGGRFAGKVAAIDYAFSYLYTWEDVPSLGSLRVPPGVPLTIQAPTLTDLARFAQFTNQPIQLNYRRQHILGLEFETVAGSFGLRGDVAYIPQRYFFTRTLQSVRKPVLQYVVGADYNAIEHFYANFQFSQTFIIDYDNAILFVDDITHEINGRISQELFNNDFKIDLRYFYNITRNAFYVNPNIVFQHWQNVKVEVGADLLDGPKDSLLGYFRTNDQVYVIVKAFF